MVDFMIQEVIAAEEEIAAAHLTLDIEAFERLLHPDYMIIPASVRFGGDEGG